MMIYKAPASVGGNLSETVSTSHRLSGRTTSSRTHYNIQGPAGAWSGEGRGKNKVLLSTSAGVS